MKNREIKVSFGTFVNLLAVAVNLACVWFNVNLAYTTHDTKVACQLVERRVSEVNTEVLATNRRVLMALGWKNTYE